MRRLTTFLAALCLAVGATMTGAAADWERAENPSVRHGEGCGAKRVRCPWVIRDGDGYRMWCEGYWGKTEVLMAESSDGRNWQTYAHSSPVLPWKPGEILIHSPSVIKDRQGVYHMWYSYSTAGYGGDGTNHIAYARSVDGRNWERYAGNPIIDQEDMPTTCGGVTVGKHDGKFHLWTSGNGQAYATSENGLDWDPRGKINFTEGVEGWLGNVSVTVHEGRFIMAYGRHPEGKEYISFASSTDGKNWKPRYLPPIEAGSKFSALLPTGEGEWMIWYKRGDVKEAKWSIWRAHYKPDNRPEDRKNMSHSEETDFTCSRE